MPKDTVNIEKERNVCDVTLPQNGSNSLRQDFVWMFFGNFIYRGCQWGILVSLAKLMDASEVGKFALGLAITAPIVMFLQLQLRGVESTDVKDLYSFGDYLGLRLIAVFLVLVLSIIISLFSYGLSSTTVVIIFVALAKITESASDIIFGLFQKHMRMDKISISMVLKGVISLAVFSLVIWLSRNTILGVLAMGLSWLGVLVCYDLPQAKYFDSTKPVFQYKKLWSLTKLAIPLGVVMGLISLQDNIPKYYIKSYHGESALGYFAAVSYVVIAARMLILSLGQSAIPRLARYYIENRKAFLQLLFKMQGTAVLMGVGVIGFGLVFGKWFLEFAYTKDYVAYFDVFIWLLVVCAVAFVNSMFGYAVTGARYFKIQVPQSILVILAILISSSILIPRYALVGAVWAMLTAMLVKAITFVCILAYCLSKKPVTEELSTENN
ncbi:MAG: oligosaccharide flippase family protein [Sedimentisphaerales bacterium]|nr:oligosaccharide flippase family protein [Sedimentisphaerales bacterium]